MPLEEDLREEVEEEDRSPYQEGRDKRAPYDFHPSILGARNMNRRYSTAPASGEPSAMTTFAFLRGAGIGKRVPYEFGIGKRSPYEFGIGKRAPYEFGIGKRSPYEFGIGKRSLKPFYWTRNSKRQKPYNFGVGKRSGWEEMETAF